ncbi:hypothetical protein [Brachybacterium sp. AOP29-B2-41]|uniref:hypothetical protein n=1 Tax=Brachybacterium sp. AOP29-B2-41 TaxID=3457704 RepID=UPI004034C626
MSESPADPGPEQTPRAMRAPLRPLVLARPLNAQWRWWAVGLALALYFVRWGPSTVRAVAYLIEPTERAAPTVGSSVQTIVGSMALAGAGLIVLAVIAAATETPRERIGLGRRPTYRKRTAVLVFLTALMLVNLTQCFGTLLVSLFPWMAGPSIEEHPVSDTFAGAVFDTIASGVGGAVEEVIVLALLIVALRAARVSWPVVCAVAVVLRVVFHIYYGLGTSIGMIIWAAGLVGLYYLFGQFIPILLAHLAFNMQLTAVASINEFAGGRGAALANAGSGFLDVVVMVLGLLCAAFIFVQLWRSDGMELKRAAG